MGTLDNWRKSSYSGFGDGNSCVEIANHRARVAVRDSKDPAHGTLTFPIGAFAPFVEALKWRKSSYSGGGDGNGCVEIANSRTRIAVRDSKTPARAPLTFPTGAVAPFIESGKSPIRHATSGP